MAQKIVAATLALVVCLCLTGCGSRISKANYDRVKDGMSLAEVEGILGKGTEQSSVSVPGINAGGVSVPGASAKGMVWQEGGKIISVNFVNDRVMGKAQVGL